MKRSQLRLGQPMEALMKLPELASFFFLYPVACTFEGARTFANARLTRDAFLLFQGRFPKCIGANLIVLVSVVTQTQLASLPFE